MSPRISLLSFVILPGLLTIGYSQTAPSNDDFENREVLISTAGSLTGTNLIAGANASATKRPGEPDIEGNSGGRSVWFTWSAPQNVIVTLKTQGSDFDTLLGVFTGSSLANLSLVASSDDTLGPDPLTSLVVFHAPSGTVYQIVIDGYRGDLGEIASGNYHLSLAYVPERYTVGAGVNDTNRGAVHISPAPDADGKYQVTTVVTLAAQPQPGWFFDSWSGDLIGSDNPVVVFLRSNMNVTAKFLSVPVATLQRSPPTITQFQVQGEGALFGSIRDFKVWHSATGTLDYVIEKDVPWLEIYPSAGSSRGETNTHTIRISPPNSGLGNYAGTIRITPLADGGLPQSVVVALRVDPPSLRLQWQRTFGSADSVKCIRQTADGGFIAGGTYSDVIRFDARGSNLWTHQFGGSLACLEQTADGGFILGGDGVEFGQLDYFVERWDAAGNKLWGRAFGGTNADQLSVVHQTPDGGFLLAGTSYSGPSGNKTSTNFGGGDYWLVRLDHNGKRLWDQSFGGIYLDQLRICEIDSSGAVLLGGDSMSGASGNKTNVNQGFWIVRIDTNGNKLAEQTISLPNLQFSDLSFVPMPDGGLTCAGFCPGPCTVGIVFRTDSNGNMKWQTNLFFGRPSVLLAIYPDPDGGFLSYWKLRTVCCDGGEYYHTVRLSADGDVLWQRQLLSSQNLRGETFTRIVPTSDGGVLLGGDNFSFARIMPPPPRSDRPFYSPLGFRLFVGRGANGLHITEYSTNLADWTALRTNLLNGTDLEIFDPTATNDPIRFYRTRPLP